MRALVMVMMTLTLPFASAVTAEAPPRVELADLGWLEGCWQGTAFGSPASECWMTAPDGRLTGMFQLVREGRQVFSEIFVLDRFEEGFELRLKHFHPDLRGWEAQDAWVTFPLRETGPGLARFDGLLYRLDDDGALHVDLDMRQGDEVRTERLSFTRAR